MRAVCALVGLFALAPCPARAEDATEDCARAAEQAQVYRGQGRLHLASEQLRVCLRTFCPEIVRRDCARWQNEVEASTPTVIVGARTAGGADLVDATVQVDGIPFLRRLDGVERAMDPGPHRLRFETPGGVAIETQVVLREGEKRRAIVVTLPGPPPGPLARESPSRGRSPATWAFAGIGMASLAGFLALGVTGVNDLHAMRNGCGRTATCASSDVASVRTRLWVGDALLGIGIGAGAIAGWLWLRADAHTAMAVSVDANPFGPRLSFEGRF